MKKKKKIIVLSGSLLCGKLRMISFWAESKMTFPLLAVSRGMWHSSQEPGASASVQSSAVGFVLWGQGGGGWGQISWPCWAFASSSVKQDSSLCFFLWRDLDELSIALDKGSTLIEYHLLASQWPMMMAQFTCQNHLTPKTLAFFLCFFPPKDHSTRTQI